MKFANIDKNGALAFAVALMFVLTAVAVLIAPAHADEYPAINRPYEINMFSGDTFRYEPTSNLNGTRFSWSGMDTLPTGVISYNTSPAVEGSSTAYFQYHPDSTGTGTVVLTANHSDSRQTITQSIEFHVFDPMAVSASYNGGASSALAGFEASASVLSSADSYTAQFTLSNGSSPSFDTTNATIQYKEIGGSSYSTFDNASGLFTVTKPTATSVLITMTDSADTGYYRFSIPASWEVEDDSDGIVKGISESDTLVFTMVVSDGIAITETTAVAIASGSRDTTITLQNTDYVTSMTSLTVTAPSELTSPLSEILATITHDDGVFNEATLTLDATAIDNDDMSSSLMTYNLTINAVGVQSFDSTDVPYDVTGTVHVNLYKSLAFTTTPVIAANGTSVFVSSGNPLDVLLTTTVTGATKITYDWGDGTTTTRSTISSSGNFYSVNHTYEVAGTYMIQIIAENDFGKTTYIKPYTTGTYINLDVNKTLKVTGISIEEGDTLVTLKANTIVQAGNNPDYKWFYTLQGGQAVEITTSDVPLLEFVEEMDGNTLVLIKDKLADNTTFTCEASFLFSGDENPTTSSASITYHDDSFFAVHGWLWIPLVILAAFMVVSMRIWMGPNPISIAFTVAVAALAVLFFVFKDINGLWSAISGLFGVVR